MSLLRPLSIGGVRLPNNLVLSPMAGYSDLPFRILCRREGAGLVCTEMVAAASIDRGQGATHLLRMRTVEEERPTSIQLFGTDPDAVADAAKKAQADCDVLGFNMGCPAHQIKAQGCGAALLDHPEKAEGLVRAIKGASRKPLLVKIRAGNGGRMDVVAFARRLESAGADGLIFHARTAAQGYSGRSDWDLIREVKANVSIPLIGNGDVTDGPSAQAALERSNADGVALGRGTLGDPHVFRRVAHYLETGQELAHPSAGERAAQFLEYLSMARALGINRDQIIHQAQRFTRGLEHAARIRSAFQGPVPLEKVAEQFERLRAAAP